MIPVAIVRRVVAMAIAAQGVIPSRVSRVSATQTDSKPWVSASCANWLPLRIREILYGSVSGG
jgi:hypothetical protein